MPEQNLEEYKRLFSREVSDGILTVGKESFD